MPVVFTGREDAPAVSAAPVSVEKSVPVEHFHSLKQRFPEMAPAQNLQR